MALARRIGVISDTHGLLRPEAFNRLAGSEAILHAGDVGSPDILKRLEEIAPVHAVRGNIDVDGPCADLPETLAVEVCGLRIFMLHIFAELAIDPAEEGFGVVLFGHSHRVKVERSTDGVLYFNPGSAGPRRFRLPITVGELIVDDDQVEARVHTLG